MLIRLRTMAIRGTGIGLPLLLCIMTASAMSRRPAPLGSPDDPPTFSRDIAPIVYRQCVPCHRPGNIGPFPLLTYRDVRKRVMQIVDVTDRGLMPPWKPQPGHGDFLDERRLTEDERNQIKQWAAADAPEGDPRDLPPAPVFPDGWQLGKPDIVLRMAEPFAIPAEGRDIYVHFVFRLPIDHDVYVRGVECRPGNPQVAHHAIGLLDSSGTARRKDAETPEQGYRGFGGPGFVPVGILGGYVPGQTPRLFDPGTGVILRKGTDLVLQMHYHPSGKPEQDQTQIGIYLTDTAPTRPALGVLLASQEIDIPPGSDRFTATDRFVLPVPLKVRSIWPHMHLIGKEVRVWATLPDGSPRRLLYINDWDFNWQDSYRYREPILLPKKTVITVESRFDNTAGNPRNPNQPPRRVRLGEQSTDEMLGVWIGGEVRSDLEMWALLAANVGHYFEVTEKGRRFAETKRREPAQRNAPPR